MATVILLEVDRCFASTDDSKLINRWKRCAKNSLIPLRVMEDYHNDDGTEKYSVELPYGIGHRSAALLIPNKLLNDDCTQWLEKMQQASDSIPR